MFPLASLAALFAGNAAASHTETHHPACVAWGEVVDARAERRRQRKARADSPTGDEAWSAARAAVREARAVMARAIDNDQTFGSDLRPPCEESSGRRFAVSNVDLVSVPLAGAAVAALAAPGPAATPQRLTLPTEVTLHPADPAWGTASDVLLGASLAALLVPHDVGLPASTYRYWGRLAVMTEAVSLTVITTESLKRAIATPRPWTQAEGVAVDPSDANAVMSMPSQSSMSGTTGSRSTGGPNRRSWR